MSGAWLPDTPANIGETAVFGMIFCQELLVLSNRVLSKSISVLQNDPLVSNGRATSLMLRQPTTLGSREHRIAMSVFDWT